MNRYLCIFYISDSKMHVSRENKRVKIISCSASNLVKSILFTEHGATFIKYIRNMNDQAYYYYSKELKYIEEANNNKL